jgi:hypothetical protein
MPDPAIEMLRHTVATLAYRAAKALRGAPPELAAFRVGPGARTPGEILAHLGDLFDWALSLANDRQAWHTSPVLSWEEGIARFFTALEFFDRRLASGEPLGCSAAKLFQGPVADALTHVGQINLLRRTAGCPVRGENYLRAEIAAGRTGAEQATPVFEFD